MSAGCILWPALVACVRRVWLAYVFIQINVSIVLRVSTHTAARPSHNLHVYVQYVRPAAGRPPATVRCVRQSVRDPRAPPPPRPPHTVRRRRAPRRNSFSLHAHRTVEPHRLAVEVRIGDRVLAHGGKLVGPPEARREGDGRGQPVAHRIGRARHHRRLEDPWGDGAHAHSKRPARGRTQGLAGIRRAAGGARVSAAARTPGRAPLAASC